MIDAESSRQEYDEKQDMCIVSKYLSTRYLLKRGKNTDTTLTKRSVNIPRDKTQQHHVPLGMINWEEHVISVVFLPRMHIPNLTMRKYQKTQSDGEQNNQQVCFQNVNVMEDTLRSYHRPEETMWDLELDLATEKEHQQENE